MQKVLITGSTGFIGKALTEDLLSKGVIVYGVSRLSKPNIVHKNYSHIFLNICDSDLIPQLELHVVDIHKIDTVFHLASPSTSTAFLNSPLSVTETILIGTMNVAKLSSLIGARMFYASSYGAAVIHTNYTFRDCYDVSKRAMETYLGDHPVNNLKPYIMRIPSVYGVGMPVHDDKIVSNFIRYSLTNKPDCFFRFPDGNSDSRNYIEVGDLIDQIYKQLEIGVSKTSSKGVDLTSTQLLQSILGIVNNTDTEFNIPKMKETIEYFRSNLI